MARQKVVLTRWRNLSITAKFASAFGVLLVLILLVSFTGYTALKVARTSTEIQRSVLEMDRSLQEARVLQRDFFLHYPTIGVSEAYELYAITATHKIATVVTLGNDLRQRVADLDANGTLEKIDTDLNIYFGQTEIYSTTFRESVTLATQLAVDDGLEAQMLLNSDLLRETLQGYNPYLINMYWDMHSFGIKYLSTRQQSVLQEAFNAANHLREGIENTSTLEAAQKAQALGYLDGYTSMAEDVLEIDKAIRSKLNGFDAQARQIDPISAELIDFAQNRIDRINELATTILIFTALAGVSLAVLVARLLNKSITRNVVMLTQAANELEAGHIEVRAQIDSGDELGQLADTFNQMSTRIGTLVTTLEQRNDNLQSRVQEYVGYMSEVAQGDLSARLILDEDNGAEDDSMVALGRNLNEMTHSLQRMIDQERFQREVIEEQQQAIQELSSPIIPVMDTPQGNIIVMPLVGAIDSLRARHITRGLLAGMREYRAKVVILDITGVPLVDTGVADHLNKTIQVARLKGVQVIVTGISDAVAETIIDLGIDWRGLDILSDLQRGLVVALDRMGIKLSE
ncbi:MAG: HAMP domain-containing protein [Chloroflexi bacterium]|nr:HAMP domain-containing protein [Chloroflexota bacterium]